MRRALLLLLLLPASAHAAPGDVDRRFGDGGTVTAGRLEGATVVAEDADRGRHLLVAGGSKVPGVARISARTGVFDPRFGTRGIALDRRIGTFVPFAVRRLTGGAVDVATYAASVDTAPAALLRFDRDGGLRSQVRAEEPFPGPLGGGGLLPGGRAFVWSRYGAEDERPEVRVIDSRGATDRSIRTDIRCASMYDCYIFALARVGDGFVAGLLSGNGYALHWFGRDGSTIRRVRLGQFRPSAIAPARGGGVLVAGPAPETRSRSGLKTRLLRLVRFRADGRRDRAFGTRGQVIAGRSGEGEGAPPRDIATDARGRIYVLVSRGGRPIVARFSARGRIDRRFSRDGLAGPRAPRGMRADEGLDLLLDTRGGIVIAGKRYTDGTSDPVFGCGIRDDFCASEVRLGVWRLKR